jgi:hypothetical protein
MLQDLLIKSGLWLIDDRTYNLRFESKTRSENQKGSLEKIFGINMRNPRIKLGKN